MQHLLCSSLRLWLPLSAQASVSAGVANVQHSIPLLHSSSSLLAVSNSSNQSLLLEHARMSLGLVTQLAASPTKEEDRGRIKPLGLVGVGTPSQVAAPWPNLRWHMVSSFKLLQRGKICNCNLRVPEKAFNSVRCWQLWQRLCGIDVAEALLIHWQGQYPGCTGVNCSDGHETSSSLLEDLIPVAELQHSTAATSITVQGGH